MEEGNLYDVAKSVELCILEMNKLIYIPLNLECEFKTQINFDLMVGIKNIVFAIHVKQTKLYLLTAKIWQQKIHKINVGEQNVAEGIMNLKRLNRGNDAQLCGKVLIKWNILASIK